MRRTCAAYHASALSDVSEVFEVIGGCVLVASRRWEAVLGLLERRRALPSLMAPIEPFEVSSVYIHVLQVFATSADVPGTGLRIVLCRISRTRIAAAAQWM